MRAEIKALHQAGPVTTIYVTHDQIEAMTLADIVVVMNGGTIEQIGTPQELYLRPKSTFVAQFIGTPATGMLDVSIQDGQLVVPNSARLDVPADLTDAASVDEPLKMGVRPKDMIVTEAGFSAADVTIDLVEPIGQEIIVFFDVAGHRCSVRLPPKATVKTGDRLGITTDVAGIHLFYAATGLSLRR